MSRLFLVLNDPLVAGRIRSTLESEHDMQVVGWATTMAQAFGAIEALKPQLVLSDLELVDGPFEELISELGKSRYGRPQTMVMAQSLADGRVMDVMREGADGYFLFEHSTQPLAAAVRQVLAGESPMAPEIARQIKQHFDELSGDRSDVVGESQNSLRLTDAERQLLRLLTEGRALGQIASDTDTSTHALGTKVRLLYRKLRYDTSASTLSLTLI